MGTVFGFLRDKLIIPSAKAASRPIKYYNIEERAFKVISRDKPKPAPPHPPMKKIMEEIRKDPTLAARSQQDPDLAKNLRKVYLNSQGKNMEITRKLNAPLSRRIHEEESEFGFEEPSTIPEGFLSVRQTLEVLQLHETDPETYPPHKLAEMYKLEEKHVTLILNHFKVFEILYPELVKKEPSNLMKAIKALP